MAAPTVHNPTNFDPAAYEVEDYLDNCPPEYSGGPVDGFAASRELWKADMIRVLGEDYARKSHRCVHCGNGRVRYITVCLHHPTGDRVVFGADCTARLGFRDRFSFKLAQLKARAEAGHARMKVWRQREAFVAAHPALAQALATLDQPVHARNTFAHDVAGKLNQYGSLSDRQVEALVASLARDVSVEARKAVEATVVRGAAPTGRLTVSGIILSTRVVDGDYGATLKMLVEVTSSRAKVWVTVPRGADVYRGDAVTVTATWTVSKDDVSFAFGKRPILVSSTPAAQLV